MKTINIGVISSGITDEILLPASKVGEEQFTLKKIYFTDASFAESAKLKYPQAEIVSNANEIVEDSTIDLVILSAPDDQKSSLMEDVIKSGKHLRVI